MKVAIDIDRSYLEAPALFDRIARRFQAAGHAVGILTARSGQQRVQAGFSPDFECYLGVGHLGRAERAIIKTQVMWRDGIDLIFDDGETHFPPEIVALNILDTGE